MVNVDDIILLRKVGIVFINVFVFGIRKMCVFYLLCFLGFE